MVRIYGRNVLLPSDFAKKCSLLKQATSALYLHHCELFIYSGLGSGSCEDGDTHDCGAQGYDCKDPYYIGCGECRR